MHGIKMQVQRSSLNFHFLFYVPFSLFFLVCFKFDFLYIQKDIGDINLYTYVYVRVLMFALVIKPGSALSVRMHL